MKAKASPLCLKNIKLKLSKLIHYMDYWCPQKHQHNVSQLYQLFSIEPKILQSRATPNIKNDTG